jgi:Major Facilitator Superfamily
MSSQRPGIEAAGSAPPVDDSPSSDARLGSRDECPVLPCLPHTALNADRIDLSGSPAPMAGDAEYSPRLTAALVVISAAQLMVVLDATMITVALPSIQRSLHFSAANLELVISGYTLAFGGLLLLGGRLGDVFGRRRMFRSPSAPHQECRRPTWALPLRS